LIPIASPFFQAILPAMSGRIRLKLRLDELWVLDPQPGAALRDVDDGALAVRKVCRFRQAAPTTFV
jgi:hypothetical protein